MFWRRLKNLWALSAYKPKTSDPKVAGMFQPDLFVKDFPTISKKLAKIVPINNEEVFPNADDTQ